MTLDGINNLLAGGNVDDLITRIKADSRPVPFDYEAIKREFEVLSHDVFDPGKRPDGRRVVKALLPTQQDREEVVSVARLGLPLQENIVKTAAAFLCATPIQIEASAKTPADKDYVSVLQKLWDDNKLDYKSKKIAKIMMAETEAAELYWSPEVEPDYWKDYKFKSKLKLKMRILANSLGDTMYPVFNDEDDMVAFCRGYITLDDQGEKVNHFDIYTAEQTVEHMRGATSNNWDAPTTTPNNIGKIPVIYYNQKRVEWANVQKMISRLEQKISNHADTNDYFDSPVLFIKGTLKSLPGKDDRGKVISGTDGSDAKYVTWDQAPESTKMEIENLWRFIHNCTDTPDISFESMKSLGTTPSGYAMMLMFMSAHLKAADKEENFGESVQRRLNYFKSWTNFMDNTTKQFSQMAVKPKFTYFMPKNVGEAISFLNDAITGGIMSTETAVRQNPLIEDADNELELIKTEKTVSQQQALDNMMGGNKGGSGAPPIGVPLPGTKKKGPVIPITTKGNPSPAAKFNTGK